MELDRTRGQAILEREQQIFGGGSRGCLNVSGKWFLVWAYLHISKTMIRHRHNMFYTCNVIYINRNFGDFSLHCFSKVAEMKLFTISSGT